jgi:dipeptide transport system ATP-binding protein
MPTWFSRSMEPTTALDVTIQAQIIELLLDLQQQENMALVLITHDLLADRQSPSRS